MQIGLTVGTVEQKLSQMILDKKVRFRCNSIISLCLCLLLLCNLMEAAFFFRPVYSLTEISSLAFWIRAQVP